MAVPTHSELSTSHDGAEPPIPDGHHPPAGSKGRSPDDYAEAADNYPNLHQPCIAYPKTIKTEDRSPEASCPMLEMRRTRTPPLRLLTTKKTTTLPRTAEASETPRARKGEETGRISWDVCTDSAVYPHEWQTPRRTSRPVQRLEPFTLPLANRFSRLPQTEPASEVHPDIGGEPTTPPQKDPHTKRPHRPPTKRAPPRLAKTEHAGGVRVQPHGDSYFLPGKVARLLFC